MINNDGDNVFLADGLLKEERKYIGPVQFEVSKLDIEKGAPSYLTKSNDIELNEKCTYVVFWTTGTRDYEELKKTIF